VLESLDEMLVPQSFLNSCIYIYPSKAHAKQAANAGGTGFLVVVPIPSETKLAWELYAVSADHVLDDMPNPVLRVNFVKGGFDTVETNRNRWQRWKDADLAACPVELEYQEHKYWFVRIEEFITRELVDVDKKNAIGIGDDTFMVGRFSAQDGVQRNTPTVRFGNISMMPSSEQRNFLVEHRSLPGYSGSPVFVWINPYLPRLRT
jgi:hypothetical protein